MRRSTNTKKKNNGNTSRKHTLDEFSDELKEILNAETWPRSIDSVVGLITEMMVIVSNQPSELRNRFDTRVLTTVSESFNNLSDILRVILNPECETRVGAPSSATSDDYQLALNYGGNQNGRLRIEPLINRGQYPPVIFFQPNGRRYKDTMVNIISGLPFLKDHAHTNTNEYQDNPGYHKALFGTLRPLRSEYLVSDKLVQLNKVLNEQHPKIMGLCSLGEKLEIDNRLNSADMLEAELRSADLLYHSLLLEINPLMNIQMKLLDNEQARSVWESAPTINQEIQSAHAKIDSRFEMDLPHWDIKDPLRYKQEIAKSLISWYQEAIDNKLGSHGRESKLQVILGKIETLDCLIKMTDHQHAQLIKIKSQLNTIENEALKVANNKVRTALNREKMNARREARQHLSQASQGGSRAWGSIAEFVERAERAERERAVARTERDQLEAERDQLEAERDRLMRQKNDLHAKSSQFCAERNQERFKREELDQMVKQLRSRVLAATLGTLLICAASVFLTWGIAVYGVTGFAGVVYSALYIGVRVYLPKILEFIFNVATATISVIVPIAFLLDSKNQLSIMKVIFGILMLGWWLFGKAALLALLWIVYEGARLVTGVVIALVLGVAVVNRMLTALRAAVNKAINILTACKLVFTPVIKGFLKILKILTQGAWGLFRQVASALVNTVRMAFQFLMRVTAKIIEQMKANRLVPLGLGLGALVCAFVKFGVVSTLAPIVQLGITCSYIVGMVLASYAGMVCLFLTSFIAVKGIVALSKSLTGCENPVWAVGLTVAVVAVLYFSPVRIITFAISLAFRQNWVKDVLNRVVQWILAKRGSPQYSARCPQDEANRGKNSWNFYGQQPNCRASSQDSGAASEDFDYGSKNNRVNENSFFRDGHSHSHWNGGAGAYWCS